MARRRIELACAQRYGKVSLIALDWAKAFDSIHIESLRDAMRRMGIPAEYCDVVLSLMRERKFYVDELGSKSGQRAQRSGITQGCTLSPLLFIVLMPALMFDAFDSLSHDARAAYEKGDLADITFADDTLLLGASPRFLSEFLSAVASAGQRYGMELHFGKLQLLNIQCNLQVPMPNGASLSASNGMTYLGTVLKEDGHMGSELGRRIGFANREVKDLCKDWRHSNVTRKRKLHIFSALIESKLLYGLACCCFTLSNDA